MKKVRPLDIIALVLLSLATMINFLSFMPMLIEQIEFGAGTQFEMGVFYFWIIQGATLGALIFGGVYVVIALIKKHRKAFVIANSALLLASVIFIALTNIFIVL